MSNIYFIVSESLVALWTFVGPLPSVNPHMPVESSFERKCVSANIANKLKALISMEDSYMLPH